ncbi:MAG: hypothetical protein K1X83_05690 [Oligoflexia bacterium]|nr:hypothetical protein [Oligoflexia bacterium]
MSGIDALRPNLAELASGRIGRFIPEPRSSLKLGSAFRNVAGGLARAFGSAASTGATVGIDPEYAELIKQQIEVQQQMQLVSMVSNLEKSRHETQMAAIRNVRVG